MATASSSMISTDRRAPPSAWRSSRLRPVELMWRALALDLKAARTDDDPLRDYRGRDDFPLLEQSLQVITRSATQPGSTTTAGWASELVNATARQFASSLAPGLFGTLSGITTGFDLDGGPLPRIPARASTPKINGSFVGEGQPIPVRRLGLTSVSLTPKKMAVISEFSNELLKSSTPNVEAVLRAEVSRDTRDAIDAVLIDNVAADTIRPAGLLAAANTPGSLTPSAATASYDKMVADLKALIAYVGGSRPVVLANPAQALSLAWAQTSSETGIGLITVISSPAVPAGKPIMLDGDSFAFAVAAPLFEGAAAGVIHEEDTTPLPISAAGSPNTVAAPSRSLWQSDSRSLRMIWPMNWVMTRTGAVASFATSVGW